MKSTWAIEDLLQEHNVWINGISGKSANPDSYMSVLQYEKLDEVLNKGIITDKEWDSVTKDWNEDPNCGPILKLTAMYISRKQLKII